MRTLQCADLFCGAGGTSQGAEDSGAGKVVFAVNHWPRAIETHSANFPHTKHVCARIDQVNPGECSKIDVLMASPECTHHSRARGGRPMSDQKRAIAWDVLKWAEYHRPSWIVVENICEFEEWGPLGRNNRPLKSKRGHTFAAWVDAIRSLGYRVDWQRLNAADFGAATSRTRLFVVARKGRRPVPWPDPTHCEDPEGQLPGMEQQPWRPAWSIIDWSKPCPSIFTRKKPLAEKTLLRIEAGLRRFCTAANLQAFLVKLRGTSKSASVDEPVPTLTAGGNHEAVAVPLVLSTCGGGVARDSGQPIPTMTTRGGAHLAVPFLAQWDNQGGNGNYVRSIQKPIPTVVTKCNTGVVIPYIIPYRSENGQQKPRTHSVDDPLPTVATNNGHAVIAPYMVDVNHGDARHANGRTHDVDKPLGTVTGHNGKALVQPFLTKFYQTGGAKSVEGPLDTITTKDRHGLAMVKLVETMQELNIVDIGFRMLDVDELARATGFRDGYIFTGNKSDRTKQIGNAVPPPFAEAICREIAAA